jgi:flavin-dependent thymidylate synthase
MNNTVELIGYYGSDIVIAQSAWTSTNRDLTEDKIERVPKLIETLWSNGHETPFEKGIVHFILTTDIATHIHILKHRISSANAESARYKEIKEDNYYIPQDWKGININFDNLDALTYGIFQGEEDWKNVLDMYTNLGNKLYHAALKDLTPTLGRKRAKESARYFKTYNSQITTDLMLNMRSFANFLKLRDSEHAQLEIREIANTMANIVLDIEGNPFKETMKQFGYVKQ